MKNDEIIKLLLVIDCSKLTFNIKQRKILRRESITSVMNDRYCEMKIYYNKLIKYKRPKNTKQNLYVMLLMD